MKIAVTGASGFVGKAVISELTARDLQVVACTRMEQEDFISAGHEVIPLDLHTPEFNVFEQLGRPDTLIHLAWSGLPHYHSSHHVVRELPAQIRFLESLVASGLKHLLVAGTCLEYGMQYGPLTENLQTAPITAYGIAKDRLRKQLTQLQQTHNFSLTWARIFYLYGKNQAENSLFSQLERAAKKGEHTFDMSLGEQLRDFLPVDTAARFLVDLCLSRKNIGTVNVCSGEPISVRRLVENWIQKTQWNIAPNLGVYALPDYEPLAFWGDSGKLKKILGHL